MALPLKDLKKNCDITGSEFFLIYYSTSATPHIKIYISNNNLNSY